MGNLEDRLDASESANQRQDASLQWHIAELRGEIGDLKALCRASRDSRGTQRSRSTSVELNGWREKLDGIRQNVDEVSASTGKTREDTRRLAERIEGITNKENIQLREDVRAAYLEIKRVDIAMADLTRENGRLNDRIVDLVGLNEESQKRMTLFEEIVSGLRREMTALAARTDENKDDVRIVKATLAASPNAPPKMSLLRKGIEEDKAVSEAARALSRRLQQETGRMPEVRLGIPRLQARTEAVRNCDETDRGVETLSQLQMVPVDCLEQMSDSVRNNNVTCAGTTPTSETCIHVLDAGLAYALPVAQDSAHAQYATAKAGTREALMVKGRLAADHSGKVISAARILEDEKSVRRSPSRRIRRPTRYRCGSRTWQCRQGLRTGSTPIMLSLLPLMC